MTHRHLPLTPQWLFWPDPWVWALLLLLLLPLLWLLWRRPEWRPAIRFSGLATLRETRGQWAHRVRVILPALRIAALACLIVAVARPQHPDESSQVFAEGIAIQMVVDTSSSMSDNDLSPPNREMSRLDVVKDVFRRFVAGEGDLPGRPNDLIGMIRFALYADSICPLTLDHKALLDALAQTQIVRRPDEDKTAIGDALALAVERLKDLKRTSGSGQQYTITSRVIILLTDGENNAGMIDPEQAGELAATQGIKVYTILAGTGQRLGFGRAPLDDRLLRRIAEVTGGKCFHARNRDSLIKIYEEIDRLERTKTEERRFVRWGELARPWLVAALACVCLQTFLDATRLRKIP
jgi:Ca-activated chloride channel family protein